jgi:hypothetical protein
MIEQLTERTALVSSAGLTTVYSVECLVKKESNSPAGVYPWWTILVQRWCIPEHGEEIDDNEPKARESDLSRMLVSRPNTPA